MNSRLDFIEWLEGLFVKITKLQVESIQQEQYQEQLAYAVLQQIHSEKKQMQSMIQKVKHLLQNNTPPESIFTNFQHISLDELKLAFTSRIQLKTQKEFIFPIRPLFSAYKQLSPQSTYESFKQNFTNILFKCKNAVFNAFALNYLQTKFAQIFPFAFFNFKSFSELSQNELIQPILDQLQLFYNLNDSEEEVEYIKLQNDFFADLNHSFHQLTVQNKSVKHTNKINDVQKWQKTQWQLNKEFKCEICKITVYGPVQMQKHFQENIHKEMLRKMGVNKNFEAYDGLLNAKDVNAVMEKIQKKE
ncbi:Splicing_factor SF3a60 subunit C-terminal [Hexamita inflata]|uniref:Splicing_factor SF3a60 subunit C-terminal n=1 Tax=Hexamita inflata TaxID=28002 RepID=A0ABP1H955_9EUKA